MTNFSKFWPETIKKTVITLWEFRFQQNSKSIIQLTETIFANYAIFMKKKWVENRLWGKSVFVCVWGGAINSFTTEA